MPRARRRRGARMRVRHPVFFEAGGRKGSAMLLEISYSGARLEASATPPMRAKVRLYVWPEGQPEPLEFAGTVVARHPDGFAMEYDDAGQETCLHVDLLQAAERRRTASAPEGLAEER